MWGDKPYYTLNEYCKLTFGEKLYKIALDAGFTCPNRDGTRGTHGCIFCSAGGSGDFAVKTSNSIDEQIAEGLSLFKGKKQAAAILLIFRHIQTLMLPYPI